MMVDASVVQYVTQQSVNRSAVPFAIADIAN
jgi:hypothetical protein